MKVLIVATVQSHVAQFHKPLMRMLKDRGYKVHVAAKDNLKEKDGLKIEFADKIFNIPFSRSPISFKNYIAYKQLGKLIDKGKYNIIHCNTPVGGFISRIVVYRKRKSSSIKIYYTAHGFHFYKGSKILNWIIYYPIEKILSNLTDKLITICWEDYEIAKRNFKTKVFHIHGVGVDETLFQPVSKERSNQIRKMLNIKENEFVLLNVGELNKNKNQSIIIDTMKLLIEKYKIDNIKLIIAGNGEMYKSLKKKVAKLNLTSKVELVGYKKNIEKYFQSCDILISSSIREGLGLNIIQGLFCCKPVIASNNRGHRELIKHGYNGYIVKNNANEYAIYIVRILLDNKEYQRISENCRESVIKYSAEKVKSELDYIYAEK
ncbi:MAG: glycosyltransferase family 4 protein [bacterium]|nr:glycosyltransferase family 4 protein [bacterium]